jgi:hypothetical protein
MPQKIIISQKEEEEETYHASFPHITLENFLRYPKISRENKPAQFFSRERVAKRSEKCDRVKLPRAPFGSIDRSSVS